MMSRLNRSSYVSPDIVDHIAGEMIAKEMWDKLATQCRRYDSATIASLIEQLVTTRLRDAETVDKHISVMGTTRTCSPWCIERQTTEARTPQQNGVAERTNRTIMEAAGAMLHPASIPPSFWVRGDGGSVSAQPLSNQGTDRGDAVSSNKKAHVSRDVTFHESVPGGTLLTTAVRPALAAVLTVTAGVRPAKATATKSRSKTRRGSGDLSRSETRRGNRDQDRSKTRRGSGSNDRSKTRRGNGDVSRSKRRRGSGGHHRSRSRRAGGEEQSGQQWRHTSRRAGGHWPTVDDQSPPPHGHGVRRRRRQRAWSRSAQWTAVSQPISSHLTSRHRATGDGQR